LVVNRRKMKKTQHTGPGQGERASATLPQQTAESHENAREPGDKIKLRPGPEESRNDSQSAKSNSDQYHRDKRMTLRLVHADTAVLDIVLSIAFELSIIDIFH